MTSVIITKKVLDFKISEIKGLSYPQVEHTLQGKESGQELNRMKWRILKRDWSRGYYGNRGILYKTPNST